MVVGALVMPLNQKANAATIALPLEKVKPLQALGGSAILAIKGKEVLFVRDSETTVRALDPVCSHKGCKVAYNSTAKRIECPCHRSAFDLDGKVIEGPASKDLKNYKGQLKDQKILFTLDE
jgi:Rieske Fe-S protein